MNRQVSACLISLLCLFSAAVARADGVVRSDFAFQLDNSIFTSSEFDFYSRLQGEEKFDIPDTIFEDEAPVLVRGIEAKIRYKLATGQKNVHLGVESMFASSELSAKLQIREIMVDSVVERIVSGVKIRAHVKATCRNVPIELKKDAARVIGGIHVHVDGEGLPSLRVPWLALEWAENAWVIGDFACDGAAGFKDQVSVQLTKYLADSMRFERDLKSRVDAQIQSYQKEMRRWFLEDRVIESGFDGLSLVLRPRKLARLDGGRFQIHGQIEFRFSNSAISTLHEIRDTPPEQTLSLYSLSLPEEAAFALNMAAYEAGFYVFRKTGSQLPGFEELRSSVLQSSFVWPELNRIQKTGEFLFDFNAPAKPRLSKFVDHGSGAIYVRTESELSVLTWAPLNGKYSAFANFRTPINGSISLSIAAMSNGSSMLKMLFINDLKMRLEAAWDPRYTPEKSHIGVDKFEEKIIKSLTTTGFDFELGPIALTRDLRLRVSSLGKIGSKWLELKLVPLTTSP